MSPDGNIPAPADPSDPSARQETIAHLRDLIASHGEDEPTPEEKPSRSKRSSNEPQSHEEWVDHGREIALRQLSFSARSSAQLLEAMLKRDVPSPAAEEVIERLTGVGLIDDAEYAAMLVRTRQAERGLSKRALMVELTRKGIDQHTAEAALDQIDAGDEADAARELVRKRVRTMREIEPTKRRNRLYGTLGRKGYSASAARAAIDEVLTEEGLELY